MNITKIAVVHSIDNLEQKIIDAYNLIENVTEENEDYFKNIFSILREVKFCIATAFEGEAKHSTSIKLPTICDYGDCGHDECSCENE